MTGLHEMTTTLADLRRLQHESWTREARAEEEVITHLEAELAAAAEQAREERARTHAELQASRARVAAGWRDLLRNLLHTTRDTSSEGSSGG